jgi:hypothetical protein
MGIKERQKFIFSWVESMAGESLSGKNRDVQVIIKSYLFLEQRRFLLKSCAPFDIKDV